MGSAAPSAWPGPPWDQQPPTNPPPGPQPRRAQDQDPPTGPQPMPAQGQPPTRKTFGWLALSLAAVGGLIVGGTVGGLGASSFGGIAADRRRVTVTATEVASRASPTHGRSHRSDGSYGISDGAYEVGVDIYPGRYRTVTPAEDNGSVCYAEVYIADDPLEPDTLETKMTYSGLTIIDIPKTGRHLLVGGLR